MASPADHIEAIAGQAQLERFHERTGGELVCHEHITENPYSLPGDDRLDGVQLLAETQVQANCKTVECRAGVRYVSACLLKVLGVHLP